MSSRISCNWTLDDGHHKSLHASGCCWVISIGILLLAHSLPGNCCWMRPYHLEVGGSGLVYAMIQISSNCLMILIHSGLKNLWWSCLRTWYGRNKWEFFCLFIFTPVSFWCFHADRFTHFEACVTQSLSFYCPDILNPSEQLTPQCVR